MLESSGKLQQIKTFPKPQIIASNLSVKKEECNQVQGAPNGAQQADKSIYSNIVSRVQKIK